MGVFDYIFTILTVLLGALWLGIGSELGKDFYKRFIRKKFVVWADKWDSKKEIIKSIYKVSK